MEMLIRCLYTPALAGGFLVVLMVLAWPVMAADYRIVPSGDPALPYRVEPVTPLPSTDVATFDEAVQLAKEFEGLTGGIATIEFGTDPAAATPTGLCSDVDEGIHVCGTADPVSVQ